MKLVALLDHELSVKDGDRVLKHLESCSECRREMDKLTRLSEELALFENAEVRPGFSSRLKQRIKDRQARPVSVFQAWIRRAAIPAGALVIVLAAATLGSRLGLTVYHWRIGGKNTAAELNHTGSVLLDDPPEGPLSRVYSRLYTGGSRG
jgi:predicted anti-sigma-YlaC factor YlaD